MKLTPEESALVSKFVQDGHTIEEIKQTPAKFRVSGRHKFGSAYYGTALIYDLALEMQEIQRQIREFHASRHLGLLIYEQRNSGNK